MGLESQQLLESTSQPRPFLPAFQQSIAEQERCQTWTHWGRQEDFWCQSVRWILSILPHRFCAVLWLHIERRNDKAKSGRESLWASYDTQAAWDMTITFRCHCWLLDKLCHDCWECCWTGSLTRSRYQSMVFGNLLSHGQSAQPMAYKLCSTAAAISFVQVIQ
jgi:hypothetical protein